jgi:hypothetical protein
MVTSSVLRQWNKKGTIGYIFMAYCTGQGYKLSHDSFKSCDTSHDDVRLPYCNCDCNFFSKSTVAAAAANGVEKLKIDPFSHRHCLKVLL